MKFYEAFKNRPILNLFIATFILMFALNVFKTYSFYNHVASKIYQDIFKNFYIVGLLNIFMFHIIFLVFRRFFKTAIYIYSILIFLLCSTDFLLIKEFSATINPIIIDAIVNTNFNEADEFIQVFFDIKFFMTIFVFALISILVLCINTNKCRCSKNKSRLNKVYHVLLTLYILAIIAFSIDMTSKILKDKDYKEKLSKNTLIEFILANLDYVSSDNYISALKNIDKHYESTTKKNSNITAKTKIKNIIMIIGESLQRDYMQIYGYKLADTPNMQKLLETNHLIKFSDTISSSTYTNASLQRMLNFSNYESTLPWYDSLNIIDMFKILGYKTSWISNQEGFNKTQNIANSVSKRADNVIYLKYGDKDSLEQVDEKLLPYISKVAKNSSEYNFYIIHLMGSHVRYDRRYPKEFIKFKQNDINITKLNEKQNAQIADYVNSVLYNDYIINEIYSIFKDYESLIVYASDHGETLYRHKDILEHGVLNRFTLEIPLIFIGSDKFIANYPEIWKRLQKAKDDPFMTDDIIHTLSDIVGAKPLEFDEKRSLISDKFNMHRKRIVQDVDYDSIKRQIEYQ